jgi:hypothetical protein
MLKPLGNIQRVGLVATLNQAQKSPLSVRDTFQGHQWIPKIIVENIKPY